MLCSPRAATTGSPSRTARSSVPLAVAWSGSDAGGSGLTGWSLSKFDGKYWAGWSLLPETLAKTIAVPTAGSTRFTILAVDGAQNVSPTLSTPTLSPRLVQNTSSAVRFGSGWSSGSSSSYSGGSARYVSTKGRSVSYKFTGRSIALIATRAKTRGNVKVYINGVYHKTVDLYSSTTRYRSVGWQMTWATSGTRTVKLVVAGTCGRPRVDVDTFVAVR